MNAGGRSSTRTSRQRRETCSTIGAPRNASIRLFFCQIEAAETAIYLTEAAEKIGDTKALNVIRQENQQHNGGLPRMTFKMATGSGKTVLMAMLIAWQALNKQSNPQDRRFSDKFLIVTPGITIRDRLRVLIPNDPGNYYRLLDILTPEQLDRLQAATVEITNFHAFLRREKIEAAEEKVYVVQTASKLVARCLLMTTDPGDLVLDPTCGSGTTAYVAEQWGRRWITIDTSRVALALARSRLMAAKYPYYLLADSEAGIRKEAELTGQAPPSPLPPTIDDVRRGFVYERVPHVTLKSIAQNPDIREGMSRDEIDAAIARHAETETLFDRPYEDRKVVRVSGPFTVESLSPHRVLVDGPEDAAGRRVGARRSTPAPSSRASSTTSAGPASRTPSAPSGSSSPGSTRTRASRSKESGSTARTARRGPSRSRSAPSSAPSAPSSSATPPRRPSSSPTCSSSAASRSTRWRGRRRRPSAG